MASLPERPLVALEDDVVLKRTARKSTYVPKKMVPTPSSYSTSGDSCSLKSLSPTLDGPVKVNAHNSSPDSVLSRSTTFASDLVEGSPTAEKFASVEEMQTERIRKLQTARKSFQNENNRFFSPTPSPSKLDRGPVTRNGFSSPSSLSSSASSRGTPEYSGSKLSKPRIRKFQNSLRDVPNNSADMKIPIVTLECDIRRVFGTPRTLSMDYLNANDHQNRSITDANDDEIAIPAARISGEDQRRLRNSLEPHLANACEREVDKGKSPSPNDAYKVGILEDENSSLFGGRNSEDSFVEGFNDEFSLESPYPHVTDNTWVLKKIGSGSISTSTRGRCKRRGRKPRRRLCPRVCQPSKPVTDQIFIETLFSNKEQSISKLKDDILSANQKPAQVQPQVNSSSIGSKLSLLQHLPNIDVIDDVEFLSFETEDDLHRFVKRHPSYTFDFTGRNGVMRLHGEPIRLTKTTDVTKIKGWRNKIFASDFSANAQSSDADCSSLKQFLLKPQTVNNFDKNSQGTLESSLYNQDDNTEENYDEEPLDLDIDVYDDISQNESENDVIEDEDTDNELAVTSSTSKVEDEYTTESLLQEESGPSLSNVRDSGSATGEKCNKSAFISDYLDDFLRNKSELKTSLSLSKVEEPTSEKIDTKVVWPAQAGSPNSEMSKIKPPPFPTRRPSKGFTTGQQRKVGESSSTIPADDVRKPVSETISENAEVVKKPVCGSYLPKSRTPSWKLAVITLTDAIYAANAVIGNSRVASTKVRRQRRPKFVLPVNWGPSCTSNLIKELKCSNFLVVVTKQQAEMAASACIRPRNGASPAVNCEEGSTSSELKEFTLLEKSDFDMVSNREDEMKLEEDDISDAKPPSPYPVNEQTNEFASTSGCSKPFCQLGCVCDSLKVPKRKRRHCGKSLCMLACICKTADKKVVVVEDPLARHKRQIRLPARLKDSFLWNGGRDLPLNFDWDMSVHRKGELKDDTSRLLWKAGAKWGVPAVRGKEGRRKYNKVSRTNKQMGEPIIVGHNLTESLDRGEITLNPYGTMTKFVPNPNNTSGISNSPPKSTADPFKRPHRPLLPGSVESSRANLQRALTKQLPINRKSCVVNVKRVLDQEGGWKIVYPNKSKTVPPSEDGLSRVAGLRFDEPNLMMPHDWRFITKPPEENPECQKRRRSYHSNTYQAANTISLNSKGVGKRQHDRGMHQRRFEMKMALERLSYLVKPLAVKMKTENPGFVVDTKSCVIDVATLSIKRLKQQEMELLLTKSTLLSRRKSLFNRYTTFLTDVDLEGQKSSIKELARRLQSCCMGQVVNRKVYRDSRSASKIMPCSVVRKRPRRNVERDEDNNETVNSFECEDYLSEHSIAGEGEENVLDEPRVVIENDLDDEEMDTTIVDISSVAGKDVQSAVDHPPASLTTVSSSAAPQGSGVLTAVKNMLPSVGRWRKLMPKPSIISRTTAAAVEAPGGDEYEPTSPTKDSGKDISIDENGTIAADNYDNSATHKISKVSGGTYEYCTGGRITKDSFTFKFPGSLNIRPVERSPVPNGDANNESQAQTSGEPINTFENISNQGQLLKMANGEQQRIPPGTRFVLYPVGGKALPNGVTKGFSTFQSQVRANGGSAMVKGSSGSAAAVGGANNNGHYATILIPVSMLPATSVGVNAYTGKKLSPNSGMGTSTSGIILQPVATATSATNTGGGSDSGSGISSTGEQCDALKFAKSKVRLTFNNPSVIAKLLQTNSGEETKEVESIPDIEDTNEMVAEVTTTLKSSSNMCAPVIKVVRARFPSISMKNSEETVVGQSVDTTVEELQDEQCYNVDDELAKFEEMPKIVGFSSISEDEFRCKDDSVEPL